ncbi:hypothetical protein [Lacticaseibacillus paracasei]|uniref:hypothetical protein n=1 Tax=Lacticaseibacillus paracasei TaxID=1597 RepID=UPI00192AE158|nr:hypothetical protein [Lacticaseibacillus paracasei]CAD7484157.1 hypothetical protein LPIBR_50038 [Lacticaseibacillus paracasei]
MNENFLRLIESERPKLTQEILNAQETLLVFDTNTLIDLSRQSRETVDNFLIAMDKSYATKLCPAMVAWELDENGRKLGAPIRLRTPMKDLENSLKTPIKK